MLPVRPDSRNIATTSSSLAPQTAIQSRNSDMKALSSGGACATSITGVSMAVSLARLSGNTKSGGRLTYDGWLTLHQHPACHSEWAKLKTLMIQMKTDNWALTCIDLFPKLTEVSVCLEQFDNIDQTPSMATDWETGCWLPPAPIILKKLPGIRHAWWRNWRTHLSTVWRLSLTGLAATASNKLPVWSSLTTKTRPIYGHCLKTVTERLAASHK